MDTESKLEIAVILILLIAVIAIYVLKNSSPPSPAASTTAKPRQINVGLPPLINLDATELGSIDRKFFKLKNQTERSVGPTEIEGPVFGRASESYQPQFYEPPFSGTIIFKSTPSDFSFETGTWEFLQVKQFDAGNYFHFRTVFTFTEQSKSQRVFEFETASGTKIGFGQADASNGLSMEVSPSPNLQFLKKTPPLLVNTPAFTELTNLVNIEFYVWGSFDFVTGKAGYYGYYVKADKSLRTFSVVGTIDPYPFGDTLFTTNYVGHSFQPGNPSGNTNMVLKSLLITKDHSNGKAWMQRFLMKYGYKGTICNPPARNFCQKKAGQTAPGCVPWTSNSKITPICITVPGLDRNKTVEQVPCDSDRVFFPYIDLFSRGDYVSSKSSVDSGASFYEINPVTIDFRKRLMISGQFILHTSQHGWYQRILELRMSTDLGINLILGQVRNESIIEFALNTPRGQVRVEVGQIPQVPNFTINKKTWPDSDSPFVLANNGQIKAPSQLYSYEIHPGYPIQKSVGKMSVFAVVGDGKMSLAVNGKLSQIALPSGYTDQILTFDSNRVGFTSQPWVGGESSYTDASIAHIELVNDV